MGRPMTLQSLFGDQAYSLDEDEDDDLDALEPDNVCASCGDEIELADEVLLLEVVHIHANEANQLEFFIVQDEAGDYKFTPHFFCVECWREVASDLNDLLSDVPPQNAAKKPVHKCPHCGSTIDDWTTVATLRVGELHRANQQPEGEAEPIFYDTKPGGVVCSGCLQLINDELIEMWEAE